MALRTTAAATTAAGGRATTAAGGRATTAAGGRATTAAAAVVVSAVVVVSVVVGTVVATAANANDAPRVATTLLASLEWSFLIAIASLSSFEMDF